MQQPIFNLSCIKVKLAEQNNLNLEKSMRISSKFQNMDVFLIKINMQKLLLIIANDKK